MKCEEFFHLCLMQRLCMCCRKTGQRLSKLFDMIDMVIENQTLRVATGVLNEIMSEAVAMQHHRQTKENV